MASQLLIVVPKQASPAIPPSEDRLGGVQHGEALTVLNLSGVATRPVEADTFVDKLLTPISAAMDAMHDKFKGLAIDEIKICLAVTAEGDIGIASAGVESSIEVTFKYRPSSPKAEVSPSA